MDRFKDWLTQPRNAFGLLCIVASMWLRAYPDAVIQQGEQIEDIYFAAGAAFAIGIGCLAGLKHPHL